MKKIAKNLFLISIIFLFFTNVVFGQEALKSIEEEYYDFLSLNGLVERPTLGYRTLSDSLWNFTDVESFEENEDGTFTKVRTDGQESDANIWKNNNLGTRYNLWHTSKPLNNWFMRGINQGLIARVYGPEWFNSYNTAFPYGQNDGALWQGRGYNTALTTGIRLEGYGFELTFKPQISWSQNKDYEYLPGVYNSEYSYFWAPNIDLVQRYGDSSFWTYDWGDTEFRWSWKSFTIGFGCQNPWLGPVWLNPMLGSNNAASYPKVDIGLRRTPVTLPFVNYYIGDIEGRVWTGMLQESDYFDNNPDNDKRMLNAMSCSFAPSFIPNLTIGMNRVYITTWKIKNLKYLARFITMSKANDWVGDGEDGKVTLFIDWKFDKIGFEVYGEYGIDDFPTRYSVDLFHTAIFTIGMKQILPIKSSKNLKGELFLEFNNFEMSQDFQFQWPYGGFYSHGGIIHGYTNKGQILGAGTGYAGNSQFVGIKIYYPKGSTFLYFHRSCPDNNYLFSQAVGAAVTEDNIHTQSFKTYMFWALEQEIFFMDNFSGNFGIGFMKLQYNDFDHCNPTHGFKFNASLKYCF